MNNRTREITLIALLSVVLSISGSFKLPGLIPGTEFQMSAPIAVGICATFGFKRYITCGIIASCINLMMSTHTIINVMVSITFRIVAGGIIAILGPSLIVVSIAGPIGTAIGRVVMSKVVGTPLITLLIAALPGMVYTLLSSYIVYQIMKKVIEKTPYKDVIIQKKLIKENREVTLG